MFPVLVDVYHKNKLVTKEEAEKAASDEWDRTFRWESGWVKVALTKDVDTAAGIGDILDKYGYNNEAKHIRGMCVYSCLCV